MYEYNGISMKIKPSYTGLATILDKGVLLYLASSLMNSKYCGERISKIARFISHDYLIATNKGTGGYQFNTRSQSAKPVE